VDHYRPVVPVDCVRAPLGARQRAVRSAILGGDIARRARAFDDYPANVKSTLQLRPWPRNLLRVGWLALICPVLLAACTVHRYSHTYSAPARYKFVIHAPEPEQYFIRVPDNGDFPVAPDGRVTIEFYETVKGLETKFMDAEWAGDTLFDTTNVKAVYVMKGKSVVKKIALKPAGKFIDHYPTDDSGYIVIQLDAK
jgi:hypothetical protein